MSTNDAYRELFERSADCILIIEGDRFVDCNPAAVDLFRASDTSEMLSIHPSDLSPPKQPDGRESFEKANDMIATAFEHGSHRFEWDHRRLDGEIFKAEVLLTAITEPGRRVLHSVVRDVSERKRLENELRQIQKMETLGNLSGGIAHDFNNLLVVVMGNCQMLERASLPVEQRAFVTEIRQAAEKGASLIRQLLTFSRKQEVPEEVIDLATVVEEMFGMLQRLVGEHIEVSLETSRPASIFANRSRVEQVLLNLVSNAQDAIVDGGKIAVTVGPGAAGDDAILEVSDDGSGMTAAAQRHAFEPFYTTKPVGKGTGLGLATVKNIVEQSNGEISLESTPGKGTRVTVAFPRVEDASIPRKVDTPVSDIGGTETLLVVEDDPAILRILEHLLTDAGFRVFTARNGEEGVEVASEKSVEIDLIMSDVVMPQLGGPDMILALRARGIDTPVVFMSGYTDASLHKLDALGEHVDIIEKPFNLQTLEERVRSALGARHSRSGSS